MERQAMRLGSILAPCAAVALAAAPVRADELPHALRLEYIRGPGAETCPDENSFHTLVFMQYGSYDVFKANAPTRFVVTFRRNAGRLEGNMVATDDASGALVWKRTVPARSACAGLAEELAFLISFYFLAPKPQPPAPPAPATPSPAALEPATPPPTAPAPLPPAPAPPAPPPPPRAAPAPPRAAPAPPPPAPLRFTLGLAAGLALKTAPPHLWVNVTADAGIRWPSFSFLGEFRWTPSAAVATDAKGRDQIYASQLAGAAVPCGHLGAYFVCGVGQVTQNTATPHGGVGIASSQVVSLAVGPRFGVDVRAESYRLFHLRFSTEALVTLHEPRASFEERRDAASPPGLAAVFSAAFVVDVPLK